MAAHLIGRFEAGQGFGSVGLFALASPVPGHAAAARPAVRDSSPVRRLECPAKAHPKVVLTTSVQSWLTTSQPADGPFTACALRRIPLGQTVLWESSNVMTELLPGWESRRVAARKERRRGAPQALVRRVLCQSPSRVLTGEEGTHGRNPPIERTSAWLGLALRTHLPSQHVVSKRAIIAPICALAAHSA